MIASGSPLTPQRFRCQGFIVKLPQLAIGVIFHRYVPAPCSVMGWEHAYEWWDGIAAWEVAQSRRVPPPGLQYWTWLAVAERARERRRENWRRLVIRAVAMDYDKWWCCICLCLDVARRLEFQRRREELEELGPELLWVGKRVHFGEIIQMAA